MPWLIVILGYFLGSIPTAYIAGHMLRGVDIRQVGDENMGAAAVIGHNWPVFIGFRGGCGVNTTIEVLLTVITQPMLIMAVPSILTLLLKRNVTLACAVLFIPLPLVCWWLGIPASFIIYSMALPCLVGFTHFLRTRRQVALQV